MATITNHERSLVPGKIWQKLILLLNIISQYCKSWIFCVIINNKILCMYFHVFNFHISQVVQNILTTKYSRFMVIIFKISPKKWLYRGTVAGFNEIYQKLSHTVHAGTSFTHCPSIFIFIIRIPTIRQEGRVTAWIQQCSLIGRYSWTAWGKVSWCHWVAQVN